jgi:anthranilate phosphoribosyltransferase
MGVRTFVNTVETLANPAEASVHLGSFYHLAFAKRMVETLSASETQEFDRVVFFQGQEGYDDVRPGETTVAEWTPEDGLADFTIETPDFGMDFENDDLAVEDVAGDSAAITEAVLAGERTDHFADAVALNAALRIYARDDAESIRDGLELARGTLASGAAAERLDALKTF